MELEGLENVMVAKTVARCVWISWFLRCLDGLHLESSSQQSGGQDQKAVATRSHVVVNKTGQYRLAFLDTAWST